MRFLNQFMKVVIFAGGLGTRISEETDTRPKPMVEIGGKPILWHVMKMYSQFGFNDFIICLGYKGYLIKEYFMHYYLHNSDITIELGSNKANFQYTATESFNVTLVDTGLSTKTAGRLKKVQKYIGDKDFMLTYGVDANPHKQNKWLPASHIPVVDEAKLKADRPDFIIMLPWNLQTEIMHQLAYVKEWEAKFVIPIPHLQIV